MLKAFLYSWIVMLVAVFTSCEPDWDFDSDYESEVVVEGGITVDGFAKVYLSQSKILNSTWDSIALSKLPVMSAKVTVSDGSQTEILVGRIDKGRLPLLCLYRFTNQGRSRQSVYADCHVSRERNNSAYYHS